MKILLLGAPGAGKGTQAQVLINQFKIPQISTGDLLRNELKKDSPLGQKIKLIIEAGNLVDDSIVLTLIQNRVAEQDCANGFLLDGYPRNIKQAFDLDQIGIKLDLVIEFDVDPSLIIERITGRRFHLASGRSYHVKYNPPLKEGVDDLTGEELVIRSDDNLETVTKRLDVYQEQTTPLLSYYKEQEQQGSLKYLKIDGSLSVNQVTEKLLAEINSLQL